MTAATKPGVLAVMERDGIAADTHRQVHAANDLRQRMWRESEEARATVERLATLFDEAAGYVEALSDGTGKHIDPVAAEALAARMTAELAAFRGEGA